MATRIAAALAVLLTTVLTIAAPALADGDPASDVLLGQNVFFPYSPPTSAPLQRKLNAVTAAARRGGLQIKVALIGSPVDLGVVPDLFGKPQKYAEFLDQEISFRTKQPLVVVMATGYGSVGLSPAATNALTKVAKPAGHSSDALANAAIGALAKVAAADGHPIQGISGIGGSSGSGTTTTIIVVLLAAAALATLGALVAVRRRQAASPR
jgi:MYXO-CTERM domain-containing protein